MIGIIGAIGWHTVARPDQETMDMTINGAGYDLALAFSSLQVQTTFSSSLPTGKTADLFRMDTDERGLASWILQIPEMPFTGSVGWYERGQERLMRSHPAFDVEYPESFLETLLDRCDLLVCELGFRVPTLQTIHNLATAKGKPILWIARNNQDWQKIEEHPDWQCHNLFASPHAYEDWVLHINKMAMLKETGFASLNKQGNALVIWQNSQQTVLPITTTTPYPEYRFSNIVAAVVNEMVSWDLPLLDAAESCAGTFDGWRDVHNTGGSDLERKIAKFYKDVSNLEHDALTTLLSRGAAERLLASKTLAEPLSMILVDVDHFKRINDTLGHHIGDEVLRNVALKIKTTVREKEIAVRWGGEEFVVLCQNCSEDKAAHIAERIRLSIQNVETELGKVTASFGVAGRLEHEDLEKWFIRVDSRLYHAKRNGRNQVCARDASEEPPAS